MYAIIKTGGKQYKVAEGDVLNVEKLNAEKGAEVVFDEVLAIVKKILVFKYRAKVNYRKRAGHRQPYTAVKISGIQG